MALIKCPECSTEVSERASTCPKCGCPIKEPTAGSTSPAVQAALSLWKTRKMPIIMVAAAVLLLAAMAITNPSETKHQDDAIYRWDSQSNEMSKVSVERKNNVFFSLIRVKDTNDIVGIVAFGHVWWLRSKTVKYYYWDEIANTLIKR